MLFVTLLVIHFSAAAALLYGLNWLAFRPWRRTKDAHWTERARLLWPARVSSVMWFYAVPFFMAATQSYFFPEIPAIDLLAALAAFPGGILGIWPWTRAVFPAQRFSGWLSEFVIGLAVRFLRASVLIIAGICMPARLGWTALAITTGVTAALLWFAYGGLMRFLRLAGYLGPAPERVSAIVRATAERMQLPVPSVMVMRSASANAFAAVTIHTLLFTEGAVVAFSDDELGAVCAHELGHLSEPPGVIRARILAAFILVPLIFLRPAVEVWGPLGIIGIGLAIFLASRLSRDFRHRMEKRADAMAREHEGENAGAYARALERLYEYNRVPAVLKTKGSHPNLYDRLIAAGVTPDYPRPEPAESPANTLMIVGVLAAITIFIGINRFEDEKRAWKVHHRPFPSSGMRSER